MAAEIKTIADVINNDKLNTMIEKAPESESAFLRNTIENVFTRQKRVALELDGLREEILEKFKRQEPEQVEALRKKAIAKLEFDLSLLQRLIKILQEYNNPATPLSYPAKTTPDKIVHAISGTSIIGGAKTLLNESHFSEIFCQDGILANGFAYHVPNKLYLQGFGNTHHLYGTCRANALTTAALTLNLICKGEIYLQNLREPLWIDETALAYVTTFPPDLKLSVFDPNFENFTYRFSDKFTPNGFMFPTGGYVFGGRHVVEKRAQKNIFSATDCSSWLQHLDGASSSYTTLDQINFHKAPSSIPLLAPLYDPVPKAMIQNPQRIPAGLVYTYRTDKGGHTGVTIGFLSDGPKSGLAVISNSRDVLNNIDGHGVSVYPLSDGRTHVLLSPKAAALTNRLALPSPALGKTVGAPAKKP
jgi:hypothetical protein